MSKNFYELPKYKKEKLYFPYRCTNCYKILRIKIFGEDSIIKYNCQCKNEWFISFKITDPPDLKKVIKKPKNIDSIFKLRCSNCDIIPNKDYKYLNKCLICKKLVCKKESCQLCHSHELVNEEKDLTSLKNLNTLDVICNEHSKEFIAYCKICDKDLCEICTLNEKNHELLYYKDILPQKDEFIKKYNDLNKFSNIFVTLFKGVRRKTNMRLIYFFHYREILRNIFFNFSRFSKYNKFNFALISNVLENCNFKILDSEKIIKDYNLSPTCFLNSSKYFFDFLENKNNTKINFFKNKTKRKILYFYISSPKNKYFIIGVDNIYGNEMQLYNSETFFLLEKMIFPSIINKYIFEDNLLICNFIKKPTKIYIFKINPNNEKVLFNEFNYKKTNY